MISSAALDRQSNDLTGFLVRFFFGLLLNFLDHLSGFVANFLLNIAENDTSGIIDAQIRDAFQFSDLILVNNINLLLCFVNSFLFVSYLFFFSFKRFHFFIQRFFLLQQTSLLPLDFIPTFTSFFLSFGADSMDFVLSFKYRFLLQRFCLFLRVLHDDYGFLLSTGNFSFCKGFTNKITESKE
ncbi:hypothetical protein D3C76_348390 [compost metagenome]